MIGRYQLPVSSTITARSLARAVVPTFTGGAEVRAALATDLLNAYGATTVALVDSGTSALALAMRAATRDGGVVALPAYACVDIGAAAIFARLRVRLYDVDPATLSADLDSVSRVLAQGAETIVVSHLYGYPSDVPGVAALAAAHGAVVIEDAAQGAWGSLLGTRLGSFGPLSILSFGRGKGMTGGGGGALLGIGTHYSAQLEATSRALAPAASSVRTLALAKAQWILGRPALFGIPSAIPALRLGETVYHPAHGAREISGASASLVRDALARADADLARRCHNVEQLLPAAQSASAVHAIRPLTGAEPGYLRFPVRLDASRIAREQATLGIVHGYPHTLAELPELRASLIGEEKLSGARELQRSLVTLPSHSFLDARDLRELAFWMVDEK